MKDSKLNTSIAEIEKLNDEIKNLQDQNNSLSDAEGGDYGVSLKIVTFLVLSN